MPVVAERPRVGLLGTGARRYLAMLVVFSAAAGGIAWLMKPAPPPKTAPPPAPTLLVAGEVVAPGDPVARALDGVRSYAMRELTLVMPDGERHRMSPASLGAEIDRVRLARFVRDASDAEGAMATAHREHAGDAPLEVPLPITIDQERATELLVRIKDGIDKQPTEAHVDLVKRELVQEEWGYRLDVYGTLARIDDALSTGQSEVEAAVEKVRPRVLAEQLGNVKFDHVLGYFETRYSRSARAKARTYNLRIAASKLDGTVLLPGEEFDFNERVGPRDEAHGYKVAPVIAQGELVDGIGGGTCQISGTLHGAAFFAGLEVLERRPHSRPSYYIKLGLDAAVSYPNINFRLKNTFDFPVVLHESVKNGVVRAEILGPSRSRTVTFFRRIDEVVPFEQLERETDELPKGERELSQRGVPGFRTTIFRIVRDGAYATRTKRQDVYPPTTQIVWLGTGNSDASGVKADSHPEYIADEYLTVTQGPKTRTPGEKGIPPGGGTEEKRIPGKTGRYGWQEKEGLPVFVKEADEDEPGD